MTTENDEVKSLQVFAVIGFDGSIFNGLKCHPNGIHIIYPMGNKVCVQNWNTKEMSFLSGHTNLVSTVDISPNGKYIGSGQINQIGFKASVILWDFLTKTMLTKHDLHKVRVESLIFSCDESFMISIGGRDCGQIIVFQNETKTPSCTLAASKVTTGDAVTVSALNRRPNTFVTGGDGNLRVWNINPVTKAASVIDVSMGKLKRYIISITINRNDDFGYCGTTSGDIIKIALGYSPDTNDPIPIINPSMMGCYAKCGIWKKNALRPQTILYSLGVRCIIILDDGMVIVGAGDGTIDLIEEIKSKSPLPKTKLYTPISHLFKSLKTCKLNGSVTSLQIKETQNSKAKDKIILAGTKTNEIYMINIQSFLATLVITCHSSAVNDIVFPT